jgi:hypothetical protein
MVRFGFRIPSLKKRLSARTSLKRYVRHSLGLKAPRGWGWLTNPRKAAYKRVYSRTTRGCLVVLGVWLMGLAGIAVAVTRPCELAGVFQQHELPAIKAWRSQLALMVAAPRRADCFARPTTRQVAHADCSICFTHLAKVI